MWSNIASFLQPEPKKFWLMLLAEMMHVAQRRQDMPVLVSVSPAAGGGR